MVRNQREHKQAQEMHELRQSTAQLREQVERDRIREPALALQDSICQSLESLTALVSKSIDEWDRRGLSFETGQQLVEREIGAVSREMILATEKCRSDCQQLEHDLEEHVLLTSNQLRRLKRHVSSRLANLSSFPIVSSPGEEEEEEEEEEEAVEEVDSTDCIELGAERLETRKTLIRRQRKAKVQGHVVRECKVELPLTLMAMRNHSTHVLVGVTCTCCRCSLEGRKQVVHCRPRHCLDLAFIPSVFGKLLLIDACICE